MSKKTRLAQVYTNYLMAEGYQPRVDSDGDIVFKIEGKSYLILIDGDDPSFFRLMFPAFWSIDSEEERRKVLAAADAVNGEVKCVKVHTMGDQVCASLEMFVSSPEQATAMFERALSAIRAAVTAFGIRMLMSGLRP